MPMYSFRIKADASDIEIPAVRSLLVLAAFITLLYRNQQVFALNIIVAAIMVVAAISTATLLVKYRVRSLLLLGIAAVLLALATRQFIFPLLLVAFALALKYAYRQPLIELTENHISIIKTLHKKQYNWGDFNNIILKDGVLTLDFKNNRVLQLEVDHIPDENSFNRFAASKITP